MASSVITPEKLKESAKKVLSARDKSWAQVSRDPELTEALAIVTEFFGPAVGLGTSGEIFTELQKAESPLGKALVLFEQSEVLGKYLQKTNIDNSLTAALLRDYKEHLAEQTKDQLAQKRHKTVSEQVKELREKQQKSAAELAARVAVRMAEEASVGAIPSRDQQEVALQSEQSRLEKALSISSLEGIAPLEKYADEVIEAMVGEDKLDLSPAEIAEAKSLVVASLLVGAIGDEKAILEASTEAEELEIKAGIEKQAQKADISVAEFERQNSKAVVAEVAIAAIKEVSEKKADLKEIEKALAEVPDEVIEKAQDTARKIQRQLIERQAYPELNENLALSDKNVASLVSAYNADFSQTPLAAFPSQNASELAEVIKKHDPNGKGFAQAVKLDSQGLSLEEIEKAIEHAKRNPNSKIGKLYSQKPELFNDLKGHLEKINESPIHQEIQRRQSSFRVRYEAFNNQILFKRLPQPLQKPLHAFFNPVGFVQNQIGRRAGSYFASKIAGSTALSSAKAMALRYGAKAGLSALAGVGAKFGAIAAGFGGPVGWALLGAQAALGVVNKLFSPLLQFIGAKNTGEVIRDGAIGGLVFLGTLPMMIASAVSLATAAPITFFVIVGAIIFWYIPTINIAPILSTMVQLDSNLGPLANPLIGPVGTTGGPSTAVGCFEISNAKSSWPEKYKTSLASVLEYINSNYPGYVSKLCSAPIPITYNSVQAYSNGKPYGGELLGDGTITLYPLGIAYSFGSNLYTIAHESAHFFQARQPGINNQFRSSGISAKEGFIRTYPLGKSVSEDFAETIGVYISGSKHARVNVLGDYPLHKQFAGSYIFN